MQRNLANTFLCLLIGVAVLFLGAATAVPGPPCISLTRDLIPFLAGACAVWCALPNLTTGKLWNRIGAVAFILLSVALMALPLTLVPFMLQRWGRLHLFGL
jgi:hypothetical protein